MLLKPMAHYKHKFLKCKRTNIKLQSPRVLDSTKTPSSTLQHLDVFNLITFTFKFVRLQCFNLFVFLFFLGCARVLAAHPLDL